MLLEINTNAVSTNGSTGGDGEGKGEEGAADKLVWTEGAVEVSEEGSGEGVSPPPEEEAKKEKRKKEKKKKKKRTLGGWRGGFGRRNLSWRKLPWREGPGKRRTGTERTRTEPNKNLGKAAGVSMKKSTLRLF